MLQNTAVLNKEFQLIEAIAGPFYKIIKVMMIGPNKQSNTQKNQFSLYSKVYSVQKLYARWFCYSGYNISKDTD